MAFYPRQAGTTEQQFKIGAGNGKFSQTIDASGLTGNQTWIVPNSSGSNGYVLATDGAGNLSWAPAGGAAADKTTPYYIPITETYTVDINKQALYAEDILVDGNLEVNGDLVDARDYVFDLPAPANTTVILSGNITGTGVTGAAINTTIPFIRANNSSNLGSAVSFGAKDCVMVGYGTVAGSTFNVGQSGMTLVGANATGYLGGTTAIGANAVSTSFNATSLGSRAAAGNGVPGSFNQTALGNDSQAIGTGSFAMGEFAQAVGENSTAFGPGTYAFGEKSIALGYQVFALVPGSMVTGGHGDLANTVNITLRATAPGATPTAMTVTSSPSNSLSLPPNKAYICNIQVVGYWNAELYAANIATTLYETGGVLSLVGTPVKTVITQTAGASTWNANIAVSGSVLQVLVNDDGTATGAWAGTATISMAAI